MPVPWADFFAFAPIQHYVLKALKKSNIGYNIAGGAFYIGLTMIIVAAHDFTVTFQAAAVGAVLMLPVIIMIVLHFVRAKKGKDNGDDVSE